MVAGVLLDSDGSVIQDWHAADGLNVPRTEALIDVTDATTNLNTAFIQMKRQSASHLGGYIIRGYNAFVAAEMFDAIINHPSYNEMWKRHQESAMLRSDPSATGFLIAENVRLYCYEPNSIGNLNFIPTDTGFLVPDAPGLLKGVYAPADTLETVNTPGLPFYAVPGEITARHVEWETESNVLFFCEKPSAIVNFQFA